MKNYTRDPATGEVWFQGRWYDDADELEGAEAEYAEEQTRKAEALQELHGSEEDVCL